MLKFIVFLFESTIETSKHARKNVVMNILKFVFGLALKDIMVYCVNIMMCVSCVELSVWAENRMTQSYCFIYLSFKQLITIIIV